MIYVVWKRKGMENMVLGHELATSKKYVIFQLENRMQTSDTSVSRLLRSLVKRINGNSCAFFGSQKNARS